MKGVEVMVADPSKNGAMPAPVIPGAALDPEVPGANNTDDEDMGDE